MVDDEPTDSDAYPTATREPQTRRIVPGHSAGLVALPPPGYELGKRIGRGGMGEVLTAYDQRIGREVAIKRMRATAPSDEAVNRFLREARIQARLDHPAIVPVHDIGADDRDRLYFTMKRLTGRTLAHQLEDPEAPLKPLLRAFVDVCLAIEFAHSRGVVHRDVKPSNIMLGDYGEVYLIDWGIARVLAEPELDAAAFADLDSLGDDRPELLGSSTPELIGSSTQTGTLLGTPGYIAPEQLRGDPVTPAADVYALGSILFHILAGDPLHVPGHQRAIGSTLTDPQQLPSRRTPDRAVPPELDTLCFATLDEEPANRPSARELADRVQAYLDGDRDVERRRELAAENVAAARDALRDRDDPDAHGTALRRASRALALDPDSEEAATLVGALLVEPPTTALHPDLVAEIDGHERQLGRDRSRKGIYAYLSLVAMVPMVLILEVKNWPMVVAFYAVVAIGIATSWLNTRTGRLSVPVVLVVTMALAIMFTRVSGPFVLTPLLVCCALVALTAMPWVNARTWLVVAWATAAVMLPQLFEWIGFLATTTGIGSDGRLVIGGSIFRAHGHADEIALIVATLVFTLVVGLLALGINRRRQAAQHQLYMQAWHLRRLVPGRGATMRG